MDNLGDIMPSYTPAQWAAHLRQVAQAAAGDAPPRIGDIGEAFAAAVGGGGAPAGQPRDEVALWWALAGAEVDVDACMPDAASDGPLWPHGRARGLEVWTEAELCGLHALWVLARERGRDDWARRVATVRAWHLENTQPDNATNRPWALHVFLLAGTPEGRHYAETLLHNALVTGPEPFSAWILLDAARWLTPAPGTGRESPPGHR